MRKFTSKLHVNTPIVYKCFYESCPMHYYENNQFEIHQELYDHSYLTSTKDSDEKLAMVIKCPYKMCDYYNIDVEFLKLHSNQCSPKYSRYKDNADDIIDYINSYFKTYKIEEKDGDNETEESFSTEDKTNEREKIPYFPLLKKKKNKAYVVYKKEKFKKPVINIKGSTVYEKNEEDRSGSITKNIKKNSSSSDSLQKNKKNGIESEKKSEENKIPEINQKVIHGDSEFSDVFNIIFPMGMFKINRVNDNEYPFHCGFIFCKFRFKRHSELMNHLDKFPHSLNDSLNHKSFIKKYFVQNKSKMISDEDNDDKKIINNKEKNSQSEITNENNTNKTKKLKSSNKKKIVKKNISTKCSNSNQNKSFPEEIETTNNGKNISIKIQKKNATKSNRKNLQIKRTKDKNTNNLSATNISKKSNCLSQDSILMNNSKITLKEDSFIAENIIKEKSNNNVGINTRSKNNEIYKERIQDLIKNFVSKYNIVEHFYLTDVYVFCKQSRDFITRILFNINYETKDSSHENKRLVAFNVVKDSVEIIKKIYYENFNENNIQNTNDATDINLKKNYSLLNSSINLGSFNEMIYDLNDVPQNNAEKISNDLEISKNCKIEQSDTKNNFKNGETILIEDLNKNTTIFKVEDKINDYYSGFKVIYMNNYLNLTTNNQQIEDILIRWFDSGITCSYQIDDEYLGIALNIKNVKHNLCDFKSTEKGQIVVIDMNFKNVFTVEIENGPVLSFECLRKDDNFDFVCLLKNGFVKKFTYYYNKVTEKQNIKLFTNKKTTNKKLGYKKNPESTNKLFKEIMLPVKKIIQIKMDEFYTIFATDGFSIYKIEDNQVTCMYEGKDFFRNIEVCSEFVFASDFNGKIITFNHDLKIINVQSLFKGTDSITYIESINCVVVSNSIEKSTKLFNFEVLIDDDRRLASSGESKETNKPSISKSCKKNSYNKKEIMQDKYEESETERNKNMCSNLFRRDKVTKTKELLRFDISQIKQVDDSLIAGDFCGEITFYVERKKEREKSYYTALGLKKKGKNYIIYKTSQEIELMKNFNVYNRDVTVIGIHSTKNELIFVYQGGMMIKIDKIQI